jgi:O-6-methylguanine DNA methyltransferase
VATPAGQLTVVVDVDTDDVVAAGFDQPEALMLRAAGAGPVGRLRQPPPALAAAFQRYNDGEAHALDQLSIRVEGTVFERAVTVAMRKVTGTVSYGQLAALAGYPGAARAVGSVCSGNPVAVIVPCHRVVRADGELGNYGYGLDVKRALLRAEGAIA